MNQKTRTLLMGIIPILMVGVVLMQIQIDPGVREIHKGEKSAFQGLSNEFILGPMLGLQQAVAGALWVRADEFFHEGDYDAILPIVRMVTWMDPHQLDVYITGAWHLAYNFTDSNERSDRRYIPAAQKLLEEGDANNDKVYDIAFELGWQNHDKIKDYERAEHWFRIGVDRKAEGPDRRPTEPSPMFVRHMLAHSLERQGRIDEANEIWKECIRINEEKIKTKPDDFTIKSVLDSERHNLKLNKQRQFSRFKHRINFELDQKLTRSVNLETGEPSPKDSYIYPDGPNAGKPRPPAVSEPWDAAFETQRDRKTTVRFVEPMVLELKGSQFAMGDGARVTIRLHDDNWTPRQFKEFTFNIDQSQTIMQDQHSVRNYTWGRKIDMSRDPKMYSFSRPSYYLTLEFNPRETSPFLQDRIGWSGEALSDKKYLHVKRPEKSGPIKVIRKVYKLSKEQIMGARPVTEADVVPNAEYDRALAAVKRQPEA